jgi:hypothetical protein
METHEIAANLLEGKTCYFCFYSIFNPDENKPAAACSLKKGNINQGTCKKWKQGELHCINDVKVWGNYVWSKKYRIT